MLTSETTWLSDGYKPRIIQAEKQEKEIKAVVKIERKISFTREPPRSRPVSAAVRRASSGFTKPGGNSRPQSANQTRPVIKSRVQSAPPRSSVPLSTVSAQEPSRTITNNPQQVESPNGTHLLFSPNTVSSTHTSTTQFLPNNTTSKPDPNTINFYSQQIVTRTIENAAFRQQNKTSQRSGARPSSGRVIATRPLGKPRNAWGSSRELWYPAGIPTNGRPNTPQKESHPDFCLSPSPHDLDLAGSEDSRSFLGANGGATTNRPQSSCSYRQQKPNHNHIETNRRAQSACSMRSKSPIYCSRTQQSQEDLLGPWLEDPRVGLNIGFQQDPSLLYFDRHSRCHNHNHLHHPLVLWRPQPACTSALENCGEFDVTDGSRPVSAMSMRSHVSHPGRVQRYIDNHRPRTAPSTRKELQKHAISGEQQSSGYMPHYCNFVRTKAIHDRPKGGPAADSMESLDRDEDIDDGYITNTELSPTNLYDADSRKKPAKTKTTNGNKRTGKDETDGVSEAILRAVSPTVSTGYDPESLFDRLREQGLAGSNSALNDSTVDDDLLGSPHVNFDLDDLNEKGSNHDATTQTSNLDTLLSRSSTPARDPIQIPSIDENSTDPPTNSNNGGDTKANAALVAKLIKDQEGKAAESQKSKRAACVKKEKMPGKDKKKKGKKKVKTEEVVDAVPPPEVTQVAEEANKGVPGADSGLPQVDVNIPDLPTVKAPAKEGGKTSKKRNRKTIGAPTKKAEKAETPKTETKSEPGRFYDFGDLSMATNMLEDRTLGKPTVKVPSYLSDRMVLSLQSSRFELPMDMKSLEKMSPQEYLKKHCVVSTRRKTLYQKIFTKYKEKAGWMPGKHLMRCLKDVLVNTINTVQVEELTRLLDVENDSQIDFPFFCGIAALAERILYPQFLTEDTADCTEYQKEKVEVADFCSLEWKLNGVNVSRNIKQLLESIS